MSDKRDLMRLIVSDYELFQSFLDRLGERWESEPALGLFQSAGIDGTEDDRRIGRGVRYIEYLIDTHITGGNDLDMNVASQLILKRGYNTEYLDGTWVVDVQTILYATILYRNPALSWVNPISSTSIADVGPYHLLRGMLIAIGAASAS